MFIKSSSCESVDAVYDKITKTATEFNARGDLVAGTNIASFLKGQWSVVSGRGRG